MTSQESVPQPPQHRGYARRSPEYRRLLAVLFAVGVAMFAQLYSPQALLPDIARDLGISPARAALMISMSTIGLAVAVLPLSVLADRVGRVRMIWVSLAGATLVGALSPFAPAFGLVLAGRVLEGLLLGGVPAVALAYLNEEVHHADAARAAGVYVAGTTIGGLSGRLIAAPIGELWGWRAGVLSVALVCGAATVLFALMAPRSRGFTPGRQGSARAVLAKLRRAMTPRLGAMYAQGALLMGGFVAVYNFIGFRLTAPPFNLSPTVAAFVFLGYLAGTVTSTLAGSIAARRGRFPTLLASTGVMAAGVALTLVHALPLVVAGIILTSGGFFAAHAVASGWAGFESAEARTQATGLYNVFYYVGSSFFGWAVGLPLHAVGWTGAAGLVLVLCAAAALTGIVFLRPRTAGARGSPRISSGPRS